MIETILATIDSSPGNKSVFDTAVSLAKAMKAKLILLHVLSATDPGYPILPTYVYYSVLKDSEDDLFHQKFREYATREAQFLYCLTQKAIATGVNAEYIQLSGVPGWEICQAASACAADLILIGSRKLKGIKEMFLGSVSNYVSHHAPCSVLIVRSDSNLVCDPIELSSEEKTEVDNKHKLFNQNQQVNNIF